MNEKKTETLSITVPESLKDRLAHVARQRERSLSWLAARILHDGLAAWESETPGNRSQAE